MVKCKDCRCAILTSYEDKHICKYVACRARLNEDDMGCSLKRKDKERTCLEFISY